MNDVSALAASMLRRARPAPRRMRPLTERARDDNPGVARQAREQTREAVPGMGERAAGGLRDSWRALRADIATALNAYDQATPTERGEAVVRAAPQVAFEMTGLPSARRAGRAAAEGVMMNDGGLIAEGVGEAALALSPLALGAAMRLRRAPGGAAGAVDELAVDGLADETARIPQRPTREIGRAADGSVLPVGQPRPFTRSMRGGSDDLMEGARMRAQPRGETLNWLGNDRLIRNPTEADLGRLAELGDEMKYVMDTDGNIYAFSAADAHHNNAMRALRDNGVTVRPLGAGAEVTDPDAAGFIWRNKDGSFAHENADMVETGPYSAFAQRMRPESLRGGNPARSDSPDLLAASNTDDLSNVPPLGPPSVRDSEAMRMARAERMGFDLSAPRLWTKKERDLVEQMERRIRWDEGALNIIASRAPNYVPTPPASAQDVLAQAQRIAFNAARAKPDRPLRGGERIAVFNPSTRRVRLTDAAFDPAKRDSSDLLAGVGALGAGAGGGLFLDDDTFNLFTPRRGKGGAHAAQ